MGPQEPPARRCVSLAAGTPRRAGPPYGLPAQADALRGQFWTPIEGQYSTPIDTLPVPAAEIAFQNKRAVYAILFCAVAQTLRDIAADPRHLGAEIGAIAVLHTWGQTLQHHPHLHCIVPGGGLSCDGTRWVACRPGFYLLAEADGRKSLGAISWISTYPLSAGPAGDGKWRKQWLTC